jgi:hypothetical protein
MKHAPVVSPDGMVFAFVSVIFCSLGRLATCRDNTTFQMEENAKVQALLVGKSSYKWGTWSLWTEETQEVLFG